MRAPNAHAHAPHPHDARRPYPPVRSRSRGRCSSSRAHAVHAGAPLIRGGQRRRGADLAAIAHDLVVILGVLTLATALLAIGSLVIS